MQTLAFSAIEPIERLIKTWLNSRQALIVSLNHLCSFRPFQETTDTTQLQEVLQSFCEQLVDYISFGHFTAFEKMMNITELSHHPMVRVPQHLLDSLLQTTLVALDFNDEAQQGSDLNVLEKKLSHLAEQIAQRLEWEDKLIEKYSFAKAWILDIAVSA